MGALIRPRGCSKAEEAHQNIPSREGQRSHPESPRGKAFPGYTAVSRKGNPGDSPGTQPELWGEQGQLSLLPRPPFQQPPRRPT